MYARDPVGTIASFTAVGAFVAIILGAAAEGGFDRLEGWITRGVFFGGLAGFLVTAVDALN
jgi:hypothetical protein